VIGSQTQTNIDIGQRYDAAQSDKSLGELWWLTDN
jgi:hypothetical protein